LADLPIIVLEKDSDEVYLFRSAADASDYLEPVDVDGQEFDAFDASGRAMRLEVVKDNNHEVVRIMGIPDGPVRCAEIRERLRSYFSRLRQWSEEYDSMECSTLVALLTKRFARM
jgi:hypothetical protein